MKVQLSLGLILQAELGLGVRAEGRDGGLDWLFKMLGFVFRGSRNSQVVGDRAQPSFGFV